MNKDVLSTRMDQSYSSNDEIEEEQLRQQEHYDEEIIRILSYNKCGDIRDSSRLDKLRDIQESADGSGRCCIPFGNSKSWPNCSPSMYKFTSVLQRDACPLRRPRPCNNQEIRDDIAHARTQTCLSIKSNPGNKRTCMPDSSNLQSKRGSAFRKVRRL